MIMALIYRNVGAQEGQRAAAARRADLRRRRPSGSGSSTASCRRDEFDAAVADWAGRLAAKSPVLMRLGKDAMFRQQDMALRRRARVPARAAHDRVLDRGHPGGREGVLREAGARCGRAGERRRRPALPHVGPHAGGARGAEALGARARSGRRRGAMVGSPGEPRVARLGGRPARLARLPARGRRPGRGHARRAARFPVLTSLATARSASRRCRPSPATRPTCGCCGSTRTATSTRPTRRQRLPRRHVPRGRLRALGRRLGAGDRPGARRHVGVRDLDAGERVAARDRRRRRSRGRPRSPTRSRRAGLRAPRPRRARPGGAARAVPRARRAERPGLRTLLAEVAARLRVVGIEVTALRGARRTPRRAPAGPRSSLDRRGDAAVTATGCPTAPARRAGRERPARHRAGAGLRPRHTARGRGAARARSRCSRW